MNTIRFEVPTELTIELGLQQLACINYCYAYADEFGAVKHGYSLQVAAEDIHPIRNHAFCYIPEIDGLLSGRSRYAKYSRYDKPTPHPPQVLLQLQSSLLNTVNIELSNILSKGYTSDQSVALRQLKMKLEKPITAASIATQNTWLTTVISLIVRTGCNYTLDEQKSLLEYHMKWWAVIKGLAGGFKCEVPTLTTASFNTWTNTAIEWCKLGECADRLYKQLNPNWHQRLTEIDQCQFGFDAFDKHPDIIAARAAGVSDIYNLRVSLEKAKREQLKANVLENRRKLEAQYLGLDSTNVVLFKAS